MSLDWTEPHLWCSKASIKDFKRVYKVPRSAVLQCVIPTRSLQMIVRAGGRHAATVSPPFCARRERQQRPLELLLSPRCRREAGDPAVNQQVLGRGVAGVAAPAHPPPRTPVLPARGEPSLCGQESCCYLRLQPPPQQPRV